MGKGAANVLSLAFQAVGIGGNYLYGRNKRRAAKRARQYASAVQLPPTEGGQPIPIPYGYTRVEAVQVNRDTANARPDPLPKGNAFGNIKNITGQNKRDFLLRTYVIGPAPIEDVYELRVNGMRFDDPTANNLIWGQWGGGGTPFQVAVDFDSERFQETDKFTNVTALATIQHLDLVTGN